MNPIDNYRIDTAKSCDWRQIAGLVSSGIPNALISKLGIRFVVAFCEKFADQNGSCAYIARDNADNVCGVILGSVNFRKVYSTALRSQWLKLLCVANVRLLRWSVIFWIVKSVIESLQGKSRIFESTPDAQLFVISVRKDFRGKNLAQALVQRMESFMLSQKLEGPYLILTEKNNIVSNKFYKKIGAKLIRSYEYQGREINVWHKLI